MEIYTKDLYAYAMITLYSVSGYKCNLISIDKLDSCVAEINEKCDGKHIILPSYLNEYNDTYDVNYTEDGKIYLSLKTGLNIKTKQISLLKTLPIEVIYLFKEDTVLEKIGLMNYHGGIVPIYEVLNTKYCDTCATCQNSIMVHLMEEVINSNPEYENLHLETALEQFGLCKIEEDYQKIRSNNFWCKNHKNK